MISWNSRGELGRAGRGAVDVGVAEHLAADRHPGVVDLRERRSAPRALDRSRSRSGRKNAVSRSATAAGCSAGAQVRDAVELDEAAVRDAGGDLLAEVAVGVATSDSPATASTGVRDLAEPVADVEGRQRPADAGVAVVRVLRASAAARRRSPGRGRGSPGANQRRAEPSTSAGVPAARTSRPARPSLGVADPGPGRDDHSRGDPVRRVEQSCSPTAPPTESPA